MKGLTPVEYDAMAFMAGEPPPCDGEGDHSDMQDAPFTRETYEALKARGLIEDYTCRAGCVHVAITALGRSAKNIADIIARGGMP